MTEGEIVEKTTCYANAQRNTSTYDEDTESQRPLEPDV